MIDTKLLKIDFLLARRSKEENHQHIGEAVDPGSFTNDNSL